KDQRICARAERDGLGDPGIICQCFFKLGDPRTFHEAAGPEDVLDTGCDEIPLLLELSCEIDIGHFEHGLRWARAERFCHPPDTIPTLIWRDEDASTPAKSRVAASARSRPAIAPRLAYVPGTPLLRAEQYQGFLSDDRDRVQRGWLHFRSRAGR